MVTGNKAALTQGQVWPQLAKLIVPLFFGMSLLASVGVVDAFFVSDLGTQALAAFGFAVPVLMLLQALLMGFGVGITSVAGRAMGRRDVASARAVTWHGLGAIVGLALLLIALFYSGQSYAFSALGATAETAARASEISTRRSWRCSFFQLPSPRRRHCGRSARPIRPRPSCWLERWSTPCSIHS